MITQATTGDIRTGDEVWSIHDKKWLHVVAVRENSPVEDELDFGPYGSIAAERDHLFFVKVREEYYVGMSEYGETTGLCGPFLSEIQAEEYITNLQDTASVDEDTNFSWVKLVDPEQFLKDMVEP